MPIKTSIFFLIKEECFLMGSECIHECRSIPFISFLSRYKHNGQCMYTRKEINTFISDINMSKTFLNSIETHYYAEHLFREIDWYFLLKYIYRMYFNDLIWIASIILHYTDIQRIELSIKWLSFITSVILIHAIKIYQMPKTLKLYSKGVYTLNISSNGLVHVVC